MDIYKKLLLLLIAMHVGLSILAYLMLSISASNDCICETMQSINIIAEHPGSVKANVGSLKEQIRELRTIKSSANRELQDLESKLAKLRKNVDKYTVKLSNLRDTYLKEVDDLKRMDVYVKSKQKELSDLERTYDQYTVKKDLKISVMPTENDQSKNDSRLQNDQFNNFRLRCHGYDCFDFSRCALNSQFPVYVYDIDSIGLADSRHQHKLLNIINALKSNPHYTPDPSKACLFVVVIDTDALQRSHDQYSTHAYLRRLPYWIENGQNHIIINIANKSSFSDVFQTSESYFSVIAQSAFSASSYRNDFDVVLPTFVNDSSIDAWQLLPPLLPAKREHILSFEGELQLAQDHSRELQLSRSNDSTKQDGNFDMGLANILTDIALNSALDKFYFRFICDRTDNFTISKQNEWLLCDSPEHRETILKRSTFALIIAPPNPDSLSTITLQIRLSEALKSGTIPVILGSHVHLPFDNAIKWDKVVFKLPKGRVQELPYFLRSISHADIVEYRRQGRHVWVHHYSSNQYIVDTVLVSYLFRLLTTFIFSISQNGKNVYSSLREKMDDMIYY